MARILSLHHMTAIDIDVCDLVDEAADRDCQAVSIFTHAPAGLPLAFPALTGPDTTRAFADRMHDRGLFLLNAEYFPLMPSTDIETYRAGLERGAELGAGRATTHVQIVDEAERVERFAALCALCGEYGLSLALEFTSTAKVGTLQAALDLISQSGCDNAMLTLDLLHAARTGVTVDEIARIDRQVLGAVQLCDGPLHMLSEDLRAESLGNRLPPGTGELPLVAMLQAVPSDVPIELEVPQHGARNQGISPQERIVRAINGARRVLGQVGA